MTHRNPPDLCFSVAVKKLAIGNVKNMSERKINYAADRRANSLKLNPRPRASTEFAQFMVAKKKTDIEIVQTDRIARCLNFRG